MAGIKRIYTSENQYLEDIAKSTRYFDANQYERQKESGTGLQYLNLIATGVENLPSDFDNSFYDRLSSDEKLNYFAFKTTMTDTESEDYKANEQYFNTRKEQIKNEDIFNGLSDVEKVMHTGAGLLGNLILQVGGIFEGLIDAGSFLLQGAYTALGDKEKAEYYKQNIKADNIGYNAAQDAMNTYLNQYTFVDKNIVLKGVNDIGTGIVRMLPMLIPGAGALGTSAYYLSMAGNTAQEALTVNPDIDYSNLFWYTAGSVGLEAGIEALSGKIFDGDTIAKLAFGGKGGGTGSLLKDIGLNFVSEGIEEGTSELFGSMLHTALVDNTAPIASIEDIIYAAVIGGLTGSIMTGGRALVTTPRYSVTKDGELTYTKDAPKDAKKLGLSKSYSLVNLLQEVSQNTDSIDEVTKLKAKYGESLDSIVAKHGSEYQKALAKDTETKQKQANAILDLANLMNTIGVEQFQRSSKYLESSLSEARQRVDNYLNHTDVVNKVASAVFTANNPGKSWTPTVSTNDEQALTKVLREIVPGLHVSFGQSGSEDGTPVRYINSNGSDWLFIESGTINTMGYDGLMSHAINFVIKDGLVQQLDKLNVELGSVIDMAFKEKRFRDLSLEDKQGFAERILFDPVFNKRVFLSDKKVHSQIFNYLTKETEKVRKFGRKTDANKVKFNNLLQIRNKFLNSIAEIIGTDEDYTATQSAYQLSDDELKTKIIDKSITTILNNKHRLMNINQAQQSISRTEAINDLLNNRVETDKNVDFDWTKLYDETYYNKDWVAQLKQKAATNDFGEALRDYIATAYGTELNINARDIILNTVVNQMTDDELNKTAKSLLTKEYLDSVTNQTDLQIAVANTLFNLSQDQNLDVNKNADSVVVSDSSIEGTGKIKWFKGDVHGFNLREKQYRSSRKDTETTLSRVVEDPTKSRYEKTRSIKERLKKDDSHEVIQFDEYYVNVQKQETYTKSQLNIQTSVKDAFGVNCYFYSDEIYNENTNQFEITYGFTDKNNIYIKYKEDYNFVELLHIIQHETFHILASKNREKYTEFLTTLLDNLIDSDLDTWLDILRNNYGNLPYEVLLEETCAMFVAGELDADFINAQEVKRAINDFYSNTDVKLIPQYDAPFHGRPQGIVYVNQNDKNLMVSHGVSNIEHLIKAIKQNSIVGASVAIGETPSNYGDFVLILKPHRINPNANGTTLVWNGDAYTVVHPETTYNLSQKDFNTVTKNLLKFLTQYDLPERIQRDLIEDFFKTYKSYVNGNLTVDWSQNIIAMLYYAQNKRNINTKKLVEKALIKPSSDDDIEGVSVTTIINFLKKHPELNAPKEDFYRTLLEMYDEGSIVKEELNNIEPQKTFFVKRFTREELQLKRLAHAIEYYTNSVYTYLKQAELLWDIDDNVPYIDSEDVLTYLNTTLLKNIKPVEYFQKDHNNSIELTQDALFEYMWSQKGVLKHQQYKYAEDTELGLLMESLTQLKSVEDIKIHAAARIADYFTHRASHDTVWDVLNGCLHIVAEELEVDDSIAQSIIKDLINSRGTPQEINKVLYKYGDYFILNDAVYDAINAAILVVRQIKNIYFEAKIYDRLNINDDVAAILIPDPAYEEDSYYVDRINKLIEMIDTHTPNVEKIYYTGHLDKQEKFAKYSYENPNIMLDKPLKTDNSKKEIKQPNITKEDIKQLASNKYKTGEIRKSTAKGFEDVEYEKASAMDYELQNYALLSKIKTLDDLKTVFKAISNGEISRPESTFLLDLIQQQVIPLNFKGEQSAKDLLKKHLAARTTETAQELAARSELFGKTHAVESFVKELSERTGTPVELSDKLITKWVPYYADRTNYLTKIKAEYDELLDLRKNAKDPYLIQQYTLQLKELRELARMVSDGNTAAVLDYTIRKLQDAETNKAENNEKIMEITRDIVAELVSHTNMNAPKPTYDPNKKYTLSPEHAAKVAAYWETINSFRYLAMLSSPTTWGRNALTNTLISLNAIVEDATSKNIEKTNFLRAESQANYTGDYDDNFAKFVEEEYSARVDKDTKGDKYHEKELDSIRQEYAQENDPLKKHEYLYKIKQFEQKMLNDQKWTKRRVIRNLKGTLAGSINMISNAAYSELKGMYRGDTPAEILANMKKTNSALADLFEQVYITNNGNDMIGTIQLASKLNKTSLILESIYNNSLHRGNELLFKTDNFLTKAIGKLNKAHPMAAAFVSMFVPFARTSANTTMYIINHSPIGIAKGIVQSLQTRNMYVGEMRNAIRQYYKDQYISQHKDASEDLNFDENAFSEWMSKNLSSEQLSAINGDYNAIKSVFNALAEEGKVNSSAIGSNNMFSRATAIESLTQGLNGTAWMTLGLILASMIKGFKIDEDDYLGPVLTIGDIKWKLSDLSPFATMFSVGAVINSSDNVLDGFENFFKILIDESMLNVVESALQYSDSIPDYLGNQSINIVQQYIPAVFKNITKVIDNGKKDKSGNYFEKLLKTTISNLPLFSYLVADKIDPYTGETQKIYRSGLLESLFNQISPIGFRTTAMSDTERDMRALGVETTGLTGRFTVNDKDYTVKDKQKYAKYRADYIEKQYNLIVSGKQSVTVEDDKGNRITTTYNKLTDKQKKNVINRLYTEATNMTKIKWWLDSGNSYVVTSRDLYNEYRSLYDTNKIIYKKTWSKSKFVEA